MTDYNDDLFAKEITNWLEDVTESDADGLPIPPSFTIWAEGDDLIPDIPDDVIPPSMTGPACPTDWNLFSNFYPDIEGDPDVTTGVGNIVTVRLDWKVPTLPALADRLIVQPNFDGVRICVTRRQTNYEDGIDWEEFCATCAGHFCERCPTLDCEDMIWKDIDWTYDDFWWAGWNVAAPRTKKVFPVNGWEFTNLNTGGFIKPSDGSLPGSSAEDIQWTYCITAWAYGTAGNMTSVDETQATISTRKYTLCYRGAVTTPAKDLSEYLGNNVEQIGEEC